jgi:hypothetical protein
MVVKLNFLWLPLLETGICAYDPMNSHLAILRNILELEEWTNWNQEFSQLTNRKRRGPQRNLTDTSLISVADPHFDADSEADPACHFDADPDLNVNRWVPVRYHFQEGEPLTS